MSAEMSSGTSGVDVLLSFAAQAKAGELELDPTVAQDYATACNDAIAALEGVRLIMMQHTTALPLGEFGCGHDLANILSDVTKQFIARLDEHILCLSAIHD